MRISDWSSDVCSSDLPDEPGQPVVERLPRKLQLLAELLGGLIGLQLDQLERRIVIALEEGFGAPIGGDRLDGEEIGRAPSELQSLMRISYAVFCLNKKKIDIKETDKHCT